MATNRTVPPTEPRGRGYGGAMVELGRITRLQVQTAPLKRGHEPDRWYDADRIRRVDALRVTDAGVLGHVDDEPEPVVDVHHAAHPDSRNRGDNGISLGFTGHYAGMRERFGDHLAVGVAGENLVVELDGLVGPGELAQGVTVVGDGELLLAGAQVAEPCVEFSRFALGDDRGGSLREPLQALRGGVRGYYLTVVGGGGTVLREGDVVLRGLPG